MSRTIADVLVIGAGAGGVAAAARLTQRGYRVLLVEAEDRAGGRASSHEVDGYVLNSGALALERDGAVAELYDDLGLTLDLDVPRPDTVLIVGRRALPASYGPLAWARTLAPRALRSMTTLVPRLRPRPGESTTQWLSRFTRNATVHGLVDNVCGAFFAAAGTDLPADVFLSFMSRGSGFKKIGFVPGGTAEAWTPLLDYVTEHGGQVWFDSPARRLLFDDDKHLIGAEVDHDGQRVTVHSRAVVSNIGPLHTADLAAPEDLPDGYRDSVAAATDGAAILTVHFSSPVPLVSWPGAALAVRSRRMTYGLNASSPAQRRVGEPGRYLYAASSTPRPATGAFDEEREKALLLADVRDHFPGFDQHATVLRFDVAAHDQPAQRAITGYDLPVSTPVPHLWNVGDGVKPWGQAGTAACVRSAEAAVALLVAAVPRSHAVDGVEAHPRGQRTAR